MILLIDNYDSFVHNLARYVRELGEDALVVRNDAITLDQIALLGPSHVILSPGPCTPAEAGISIATVLRYGATIPILGVCLGHQAIGVAYGGRVVRAGRPVHGKVSLISHDGKGIFDGLSSPFHATRYHSLAIAPESIPPELEIRARAEDGEIMAVEHAQHPLVGVQFHPESAASEFGYVLLERFLRGANARGDVPTGPDGTGTPYGPAQPERFVPPPADLVR